MTCAATTDEVSGQVWEDWNYDGIRNESQITGVEDVSVQLFDDCNNIMETTLTDVSGNYSFTGLDPNNTYRIEFSLPTSVDDWAEVTRQGTDNGTTVQFVQPGNCAKLGIADPADYCESNPLMTTTCFVEGGLNNTSTVDDVLVGFRYNNFNTSASPFHYGVKQDMGSLYGLAYLQSKKKILVAAYLRRHVAMGPAGIGAIYEVDPFSGTPNGTLWQDVTNYAAINSVGTIDSSADRGFTNNSILSQDELAFQQVGKTGLGDIDISSDESRLYVMDLFNRQVIVIDTDTKALIGTMPVQDPGCSNGNFRPFALNLHEGKLYIGVVCDAETSGVRSDLSAQIQRYDPATLTYETTIFTMALDQDRGAVYDRGNCAAEEYWEPWSDVFPAFCRDSGTDKFVNSEPLISDIEFIEDGSMILTFLDRFAHKTSRGNFTPDGNSMAESYSGGDIYRTHLDKSTGQYILESDGKAGPYTGWLRAADAPAQEPSDGEFFYDYHGEVHFEVGAGGLAHLPGTNEIAWVTIDPLPGGEPSSGGIRYMNTLDGTIDHSYFLYQTNQGDTGTFGKNAGLGDIEAMCSEPPIEVGNYVWKDTDDDGIQDACEAGISGVAIALVKAGTVIATTTTDNNGLYQFSSTSYHTNGTWLGTGADTALIANTAYTIRINDIQGGGQQTALNNLRLSTADANNNLEDERDSDATIVGNHAEIDFMTGRAGASNHSLDVGFTSEIIANMAQTCHANNTGNDPNDDYVIFTFSVSTIGSGTSYEVLFNNTVLATENYGTNGVIEYQDLAASNRFVADGSSTYQFVVRDVTTPSCETYLTSTAVTECSDCSTPTCLSVSFNKK